MATRGSSGTFAPHGVAPHPGDPSEPRQKRWVSSPLAVAVFGILLRLSDEEVARATIQ